MYGSIYWTLCSLGSLLFSPKRREEYKSRGIQEVYYKENHVLFLNNYTCINSKGYLQKEIRLMLNHPYEALFFGCPYFWLLFFFGIITMTFTYNVLI